MNQTVRVNETHALAAVSAMSFSPSKVKESPKHRRALPSLNPDMYAAAATGSAALAGLFGPD